MTAERPRRGIVQVLYAPADRMRKFVLQPGETRTFGRDERADFLLRDPELAGEHLQVCFDGVGFHLHQSDRAGARPRLMIDGLWRRFGEVQSGAVVTTEHTTLRFFLERRSSSGAPTLDPAAAEARKSLEAAHASGTLYGVFDAARKSRILELLEESIDPHASLYEGAKGAVLDDLAPYLVHFHPESALLDRLLAEGWGESWGVFARSSRGPKEVRRHFRRFLMVLNDVEEEKLYFRYYDPRVLSEFITIATERQKSTLLDALDELACEGPNREMLRFPRTSAFEAEERGAS